MIAQWLNFSGKIKGLLMTIALRANNSPTDLEQHLAQIDEHGITVVAEVLSPAELRTLPALIDRVCAIRESHPLQEDAKVQNFNMSKFQMSY